MDTMPGAVRLFCALFLALLLFACARPAEFVPVNGTLDLAEAIPGDWGRVCVLNPYTTNSHAKTVVGTPVNVQMRSDITMSDSITLLVTLREDDVQSLHEVSRFTVDFTHVGGRCFDRAVARFEVDSGRHPHVSPIITPVGG